MSRTPAEQIVDFIESDLARYSEEQQTEILEQVADWIECRRSDIDAPIRENEIPEA